MSRLTCKECGKLIRKLNECPRGYCVECDAAEQSMKAKKKMIRYDAFITHAGLDWGDGTD